MIGAGERVRQADEIVRSIARSFVVETMGLEPTTPCSQSWQELGSADLRVHRPVSDCAAELAVLTDSATLGEGPNRSRCTPDRYISDASSRPGDRLLSVKYTSPGRRRPHGAAAVLHPYGMMEA